MTIPVEKRFEKVADLYDKYRPGYPDEVVTYFALPKGARILDLGCGTGISARLFAAHGYEVVAIDPNEAMLEKARAHGGNVTYAVGRAESSGQPEHAFDLAYGAQAFHWFDLEATMRELRRVARHVARAVGKQVQLEGVAGVADEAELEARIDAQMWEPIYRPYRRVS